MQEFFSWALIRSVSECVNVRDIFTIDSLLTERQLKMLPRGAGRSYGDVALNHGGTIWNMRGLENFIAFDCRSGILTVEAGVLLQDIQRIFIPQGWMLPVSPGTGMVTVGGAIANDIHGKNHHVQGSFGNHIKTIKLLRTNGDVILCSQKNRPDWYGATIGGLGLTGVILEAEIQLVKTQSAWFDVHYDVFSSLDEFFEKYLVAINSHEHVVGWIDGGRQHVRGILSSGKVSAIPDTTTATKQPSSYTIPFSLPISLVNKPLIKLFNTAYFKRQAALSNVRTHYTEFLYPLDKISNWNRLYGSRGFLQYQCVFPEASSHHALAEVFHIIKQHHITPSLVVLKKFGMITPLGMLSFPMPGVTIAIDVKNQKQKTDHFFNELNHLVLAANGRIYLAKDAKMTQPVFQKIYPNYEAFCAYRDPHITSSMAKRIFGF